MHWAGTMLGRDSRFQKTLWVQRYQDGMGRATASTSLASHNIFVFVSRINTPNCGNRIRIACGALDVARDKRRYERVICIRRTMLVPGSVAHSVTLTLQPILRTFSRNPPTTSAFVLVDVFSLILTSILGYLIGSFPTSYLLVQWKSKIDIRNAGSGNVGTLNSIQVTNSRLVGIAVLVVDVLKGSAAVLLGRTVGGDEFWPGAVGGLAAVVGHNYPVWLGFKGGRGLATSAGVMFVMGWVLVAVWGAIWVVGFLIWKKVNLGNALASLGIGLAVMITPDTIVRMFLSTSIPASAFRVFCVVLMALILAKHIEPVKEHFREKQLKNSTA